MAILPCGLSEIGILIPTYRRADALRALVDNIHDATILTHTIYLVAEEHDAATVAMFGCLPAVALKGRFGSFARALNWVYRATNEPLVMVANDDLYFHDGWDEKAVARLNDAHHVVGLNDGSGDCNCFHLIRRSFVRKHSCVYDRPDMLVHEYEHLCPDTELTMYAQLRGVWVSAPDAVVEHMHWRHGKASVDHPNYAHGLATNRKDLETYARRQAKWDPQGVTPMAVAY